MEHTKCFVCSHFLVFGSLPLKIRLRNLSSSSGSFSVDTFSISSMVEAQDISFEGLNALRITSFMKVAISPNLSSDVARYDKATTFVIDFSEIKTSQNEMKPFCNIFENKINRKRLSSSLLTFWSKGVGWDSFLAQIGGYNGHKEHCIHELIYI